MHLRDAVTLSACRGKLWQTKPDALGPLKVGSALQLERSLHVIVASPHRSHSYPITVEL